MTKIHRDAFLYLEGSGKNFAQCGKCALFAPSKQCAILAMKVEPGWSCGFFLAGDYNGAKVQELVTPEEAGLYRGEVRCENCEYGGEHCQLYEILNEIPDTFDLDTEIKPHGCCNAFSAKGDEETEYAAGGNVKFRKPDDKDVLRPEAGQYDAIELSADDTMNRRFQHSAKEFTGREPDRLLGNYASGGSVHATGAFRIPADVIKALGGTVSAHAVISDMLGVSVFANNPGEIAPHLVADIGNGDIAKGRAILNKFIAHIRRQARPLPGKTVLVSGAHGAAAINVDRK